MSETIKLIDALKKVDSCIYIFIEEFDGNFQPIKPLNSTRGFRKLDVDELNSSDVFDVSKPAYRGVGIFEIHIQDVRSEDMIPLLQEFSNYIEEEGEDEFYSLDEFLEEVKYEERLSPMSFKSISQSKQIYSTNYNKEIRELKKGSSIPGIIGDEIIVDTNTFEIGMTSLAGVVIGKKQFWL